MSIILATQSYSLYDSSVYLICIVYLNCILISSGAVNNCLFFGGGRSSLRILNSASWGAEYIILFATTRP